MKMVDVDTMKTVLRSLIISCPGGITIDTLCRDYRTNEGEEIPYRQLGFKNVVDFLYSLTDTVRVRGNSVSAVSSAETAHVESLVAKQRKGKSRKKAGGGFHRAETGRRRTLTGNLNRSYSRPYDPVNTRPQYPTNQNSYRNPYVPRPRFSQEASRSPEPTTASPEHYRPTKNNYFDDESDYDSEDEHYNEFDVVNGNESRERCSPELYRDDAVKKLIHQRIETHREVARPSSCTLEMDDLIFGDDRRTDRDALSGGEPDDDDDDGDCFISDRMKKNLQDIVAQYPSGLWCSALPEQYLVWHGVPLDCRQLGFVSVLQMAMTLPSIFRCVRVDEGDWKLFDARFPPPEQCMNFSNDDDAELPEGCRVPPKVLERIQSILSLKSKAISVNDFSVNYLILFGVSILDEVDGFRDVETLLKSVSDDVVVVKEVNGETVVHPPHMEEECALPDLSWDEVRKTMPPNACGPEVKCPKLVLPSSMHFGEYIVLRVAEVYNPCKFYLNLVRPGDYVKKQEQLMDDLQKFYGKKENSFKAPCVQWQRGQHCVTLYNQEWHRAEILKIVDNDRVKVNYFDYGTVGEVCKDDVRLLAREFCDLPMLAVKATLSAIRPAKGAKSFSAEAIQAFFALVTEKTLVGSVSRVVHDVPFVSLALVDTEGGDDIHINDELVESGFAVFSSSQDVEDEWQDEESGEEETSTNQEPFPSANKTEQRVDAPETWNQSGAAPAAAPPAAAPPAAAPPAAVPPAAAPQPTPLTAPNRTAPKISRPPPGFQALDHSRHLPPGMPSMAAPNMYFLNNAIPPMLNPPPPGIPPLNSLPPGIPPLIPPGAVFNPAFYNRPVLNQGPLAAQHFNPYCNPLLLQQMLRPPAGDWAHNQWRVGNPLVQFPRYPFQLPSVNNSSVVPPRPPATLYPRNNFPASSPRYSGAAAAAASSVKKGGVVSREKAPEGGPTKKEANPPESRDDATSLAVALPVVSTSSWAAASQKTPSPPAMTPPPTPPPTPPELLTEAVQKALKVEAGKGSDFPRGSVSHAEPASGKSSESAEKSETRTRVDGPLPPKSVPESPAVQDRNSDESNTSKPTQRKGPTPKIVWQPLDVFLGTVYLLNHRGEAYVSSDDLAKSCLSLSGHAALLQTLESRSTLVSFQRLRREDHPEFFASLETCPGLSNILDSEDNLLVNLVPLKNIVTVVLAAGIKEPKIIFAFQAARRDFNPDANYWSQTS